MNGQNTTNVEAALEVLLNEIDDALEAMNNAGAAALRRAHLGVDARRHGEVRVRG